MILEGLLQTNQSVNDYGLSSKTCLASDELAVPPEKLTACLCPNKITGGVLPFSPSEPGEPIIEARS